MTPPAPAPVPLPDLILASASPRRRELLERLGLRLLVAPVEIDESPLEGEAARDYVRRLAEQKCSAAVEQIHAAADPHGPADAHGPAVLAADTTVVLDGVIMGKPPDASAARDMLARLGGRVHQVITAFTIRHGARTVNRAVTTQVSMRLLAPEEIEAYVVSNEWRDKAGGYAVQGRAAVFVTELRGSITNVIGLPLAEVVADLRALNALPNYPAHGFGVDTSTPEAP